MGIDNYRNSCDIIIPDNNLYGFRNISNAKRTRVDIVFVWSNLLCCRALDRSPLPLRHKPLLPLPSGRPIVPVSVSEAQRWMTLPRGRRQERADDPAPAPTLFTDLWLPWRVTPLCVCSTAVHCTVNGLASGAPDPTGSPI